MSKDKHITPSEYPIHEFRTTNEAKALDVILNLFQHQRQLAVSYSGSEIVINYTSGPSHK